MGRIVLLFACFWLGFLILRESGWALFGIEEQVAWALLLPGVYLLGLMIWNNE
ncbi:MAG: hypothetical protein ACM31O_00390 [Bacteroidota bacterium]|jgi:hypothetical protein